MLEKLGRWRYAIALLASACVGAAVAAAETPLVLTYSVVSNPQNRLPFDYSFQLALDVGHPSWTPGDSFDWIIFGDGGTDPSPLGEFVANKASFPVGPFTVDNDFTSGTDHHGPSLITLGGPGWVPTLQANKLVWSGQAENYVGQGNLFFSNIFGTGQQANLEPAVLVPEPSTYLLLLAGLAVIGGVARQRATQPAPC